MSDEVNTEVVKEAAGGEPPELAGLGWKTELPTSLRDNEAFANYKTKNELWTGHIDLVNKAKTLEGKLENAIPRLSDKATEDEKAAFFKALGRPDAPDGYVFDEEEGITIDQDMVDWYRKLVFEAGIPQNAASKLYASYNEKMKSLVAQKEEAAKKAIESTAEALKKEWGGDYDKNVEFAKRAWVSLAGEELKNVLEETGLGNDPRFTKAFFNIGKKMGEDNLIGGEAPTTSRPQGMVYNMPKFE